MQVSVFRADWLRLAGFPLGFGLMTVLMSGTLNRVMIVERELPASLVALFFAIPLLLAPVRVWLGYLSDGYPILGKRREPYIILGALLAGLGVTGAGLLIGLTGSVTLWLVGGALLAFFAYGMGSNLASNTFEALLADTFQGAARPRAVTIFKVVMFVGIMGGAIGLGRLLEPFDPERFAVIVAGSMLAVTLLAVAGVWRQEPSTHAVRQASREATAAGFMVTVREVVWRDQQARRFFVLVVLSVLGTLAQDVLLEPYGALVLDMSVGQTTRLTAIWGAGTILAMLGGGVRWVNQFGYLRMLRLGLVINVIVFAGLILAGMTGSVTAFMALVFALGVGTGLAAAGLLTAVIEFTTFTRAGLLMGVWGLAHEFGQAFGGLMGGAVVDVVRALTDGDALAAYGTVFASEGLLLVVALVLSTRLDAASAQAGEVFAPGD